MNVVVQARLQSVVHRHHKAGTVGPALLAFRYVYSFVYNHIVVFDTMDVNTYAE
jgi:hypothetical protein